MLTKMCFFSVVADNRQFNTPWRVLTSWRNCYIPTENQSDCIVKYQERYEMQLIWEADTTDSVKQQQGGFFLKSALFRLRSALLSLRKPEMFFHFRNQRKISVATERKPRPPTASHPTGAARAGSEVRDFTEAASSHSLCDCRGHNGADERICSIPSSSEERCRTDGAKAPRLREGNSDTGQQNFPVARRCAWGREAWMWMALCVATCIWITRQFC